MSTLLALDGLKFGDARVVVPETADIAPNFRDGSNNGLLQVALREMYLDYDYGKYGPWPRNKGLILELELEPGDGEFHTNVVRVLPNERRQWAVHSDHTARRPDLSPFVKRGDEWSEAHYITIEVAGSADLPSLVRAYPGLYRPPLPWMSSAGDADGGIEVACKYWATHAYVYARNLVRGRVTNQAPLWFTNYESYARRRHGNTGRRAHSARRR